MVLKLVAVDLDNPGTFIFKEVPEGLPPGTLQQTLWHNGTNWVADNILKVGTNAYGQKEIITDSELNYFRVNSAGKIELVSGGNIAIYAGDGSAYITMNGKIRLRQEESVRGSRLLFAKDTTFGTSYLDTQVMTIPDGTVGQFLSTDGSGTYSFKSPNVIKYLPFDVTSTDSSTFADWTMGIGLIEANVTYELSLHLVFGNIAGRNGVFKLVADPATFTYRPIATGNYNSINDSAIIMRNTNEDKPEILDNSAEYVFQTTGYTSSIIEMRGIFRSTVPIVNLRLNFKTLDNLSALVLKQYSYLKLSR